MKAPSLKAAQCGEPSYLWREGQQRRLEMVLQVVGDLVQGDVLDNGCGVGMYVQHLGEHGGRVFGMEYEFERLLKARGVSPRLACSAGENLPYPSASFDLVLSHEVLEHVADDRLAVEEILRVLRPGGCLALFVPNRGYPFETHGIYWGGKYRFGNKPLVNYLPNFLRDRLAPHVRVYTRRDLAKLFKDLPLRILERTVIFGAYDNLVSRFGAFGKALRWFLQALERTPLRMFGLSHFWVLEKVLPGQEPEKKKKSFLNW
ncbi:class I SAM-dependent methyltransferase [Chloroflexota bacterium]